MLFEDFFQLRSVRGHYLFTDNFVWPLFKPYFLSTNRRQENEHSFVELFNRLSIGKATSEDISILSKRLLNLYPDVCTDNMLHIYQTLREVREFNEDIQKKVNPNVRTHEATHTFSPFHVSSSGQTVPDDLIPADDRQGVGYHEGYQCHLEQELCYYEIYVQKRDL